MDEETVNYSKTPDSSVVATLQRRIESGESRLSFDDRFGYLPAVLKELNVSPSSQMLVGSRSSPVIE